MQPTILEEIHTPVICLHHACSYVTSPHMPTVTSSPTLLPQPPSLPTLSSCSFTLRCGFDILARPINETAHYMVCRDFLLAAHAPVCL